MSPENTSSEFFLPDISWDAIEPLAIDYFKFWETGEDIRWCRWAWNYLSQTGYFDLFAHKENLFNAHIPLLALTYQYFADFENINEHVRFNPLSEKKLIQIKELLPLCSNNLFSELVEQFRSRPELFSAEICLSYVEATNDEYICINKRNELYKNFLIVLGDIYINPGVADIYLSLVGYEGRSGKLDFNCLLEILDN